VLSGRENNSDLVLWTNGNTSIGQSSDSGYKLDVNGTGRFSGNVVLSGSDSRFNGGDSVGRLIMSNSNTTTYIGLYGASHPSIPYVMSFVVNSAVALTIASTGAASFANSVTAGGIIQVPSAVNGGYFTMAESGNSNSRTWRMASDGYGYGDWALQQATAFNGSTYDCKLIIQNSGLTIGANAGTGTGNLYAATINSSTGYTIANDITWTNNLGYGLKGQDGTRFLSYTTSGTVLGSSGSVRTIIQGNGGNVLIGTTTDAGYKLDVNGTGRFTSSLRTSDIFVQNGTSGGYVSLRNGGAGAAGYMEIYSNNGTTRLGYIGYSISNLLYTAENGASHQFEGGAATFSSSVGIGGTLTSGYGILQVNASASYTTIASLIKLSTGANSYANRQSVFEFGQGGTNPNGYSHQISASTSGAAIDNTLNFALCNGGETTRVNVMTLLGNGNVGIGFTSTFGKLSVNVDAAAPASSGNMTNGVTIANTTGGRAINIGVNESGAYNYIQSSYVNNADVGVNLAFFTGATEKMRLFSNGNVFIGSSPTDSGQKLQVNGITQTNGLAISSTTFSSSTTMTDAYFAWRFGGATGQTLTLYSSSGHNNMHFIKNESGVSLTISGTIMTLSSGAPASSIVLGPYKTIQIVSFGSSTWYIMYQTT
jgi:hypothetical protein